MPDVTRVEIGDAVLYVEAERLGPDTELEGVRDAVPDLTGLGRALSAFAGQIGDALHQAAPHRATVEFGCELALDAGGLTALIVKGSAGASLRVTLEWTKRAD
ncbi:hypothetical protein J7E93_17375 [Streptomyces sp. ISL-36]|uniref:CU044_2847 family protein n=1 Tax=Streptomyces sp. ISL-36 TaxID=2819182 RepID=UPI001BE923FE|nr:CU044_2847 family protein [Streptomyces sp. ISL-36]MBT2441850.1 hypothetical protein [Streptomyces sp. ISL-36]